MNNRIFSLHRSATEPSGSNPNTVTITKKYEVYDDNLTLQEKEVKVEFTPATSYEDAVAKLGNDPAKLLEGANIVLRREALSNARAAAGVSGGINRGVLMEFIKPYRELPQFASLVTATDKRKATAEEWNKQTQAILEQIKNVPFIMDGIKVASAKANADEE